MDLIEIDGRITALVQQRNAALDQVVVLNGILAKLQKEQADAKAAVKEPTNPSTD